MDDHTYGLALQYGNPGPASYSPGAQAWHFARRFRPPYTIYYTGLTNRVVAPSSDLPAEKKDNQQERELLKEYPELIGLTSSYARDEERSRFISQATSYFHPHISSLFEFGHARLSKAVRWTVRLRTVPITALATGKNGNVLSFRVIDDEPINMMQLNGSPLPIRLPTISASNTVNWVCGEAPIRQIRFADSFEEPECLFAVRLLSRTSIFRPTYYQESLVINQPENADHPHSNTQLSHIDPNLLTEIDVSQTGGYAHVDVAFNPWYQKQFAIIDERGHWSIWVLNDIVPQDKDTAPEQLHSGSLPYLDVNHDEDQGNTDQMPYDGWGRVEWIGDMYTFIACTRRIAMLYVTEEATPVSYNLQLNCQFSTEWILDLKTCLQKSSHVFILTTMRILCFDISSREQESPFLLPLFSWQHGRDPDDLTLRFTSLSVGQEYYLLLYSRLDTCILSFQVPVNQSDDTNSSMSDPFYIFVPGIADTNGLITNRYELPIRQVLFKEVEQSSLKPRVSFTPRNRLMKLFVLDNTLAIREYLFSKYYNPSIEGEITTTREMLSFGKALYLFRRKEKGAATLITLNDESDNEASLRPPEQRKARINVDFARVYALLSTGDTRYVRKSLIAAHKHQSFREYVEHLMTATSTSADDGPEFLQTMLEIINNPPASSDIDDSFQELESLKSRFAPVNISAEMALLFLPLKVSTKSFEEGIKGIRSFQPFHLLELYNKLVDDWLSPLPRSLPSWTRMSKEKLIRQVSIELSLASMVQVDVPDPDGDALNSSQISLPQQRSLGKSQAGNSNKIIEEDEDHQKSNGMLDLKTVAPQSMGIPAAGAAQQVLSNWIIGGSPDSFDWEMVFATDGGEKDGRSRSKERTRTRSRSRATSERPKVSRSSPIVPIVQYSGSQPQQSSSRIPLQSSQISEDALPMTQVERGIFGSREAGKRSNVKVRKKKRAAGF